MCRSDPQMAVVVILTIASRGLRIAGSGTVSTRIFSLPSQHTARIEDSLGGRCSGDLAGLEQLFEVPQVFANGLRGLPAAERGDKRTRLACRRRVLEVHAHLGAPPATHRIEIHR